MLNNIFNTVKNADDFTKHIINWGISSKSSRKDLLGMANVNADDFVQKLIDGGGVFDSNDINFIKNTLEAQRMEATRVLEDVNRRVNLFGNNVKPSKVHDNLKFSSVIGKEEGALSTMYNSLTKEQVDRIVQNTANQVYSELGFNDIPMRININYGTGARKAGENFGLGDSTPLGVINIHFDEMMRYNNTYGETQQQLVNELIDTVSHEMRHQYQQHFDSANYIEDMRNLVSSDADYKGYRKQYLEKDARGYAKKYVRKNAKREYKETLKELPNTDAQQYKEGFVGNLRKKIDKITGRYKTVESNQTPPTQEPPQPQPTPQPQPQPQPQNTPPQSPPTQQTPAPEPPPQNKPQQQPKKNKPLHNKHTNKKQPTGNPPDQSQKKPTQSSKQTRKQNKQRKQAKEQAKQQQQTQTQQQTQQQTQPQPPPQQQQQQQPQSQQQQPQPNQQQQNTTKQQNPNTQQSTNSQQQSKNTSNTKVPPKNYATVDESSIIEKEFAGEGYTGNIKNGYVQDITIGDDTYGIKTNVADGSIDIFDADGNLIADQEIIKDVNEKVFDETGKFYQGLTDEEWDTVINNAENYRFNANQASEKLTQKDASMLNMNDAINSRQKILETEREAIKKAGETAKGKKEKKKLSDQRNVLDIKWNEAERIKQINTHKVEASARRSAARDKFNKSLGLDAFEAGSDEFKQALEALKGTDEYTAAMKVFKKDLKGIDVMKRSGIKETNRVIDAKIKGLTGKGLTVSNMITIGSAAIGAVNKYKESRAEGKGIVSSAARAGATAIAAEVMGPGAAVAVMGARALGNAAVEAGDLLYKESRRMNSMSNFTPLGGVNFQDSQELATMRQSGMELAKMSQYNLEQTLMGAEAKHLHR